MASKLSGGPTFGVFPSAGGGEAGPMTGLALRIAPAGRLPRERRPMQHRVPLLHPQHILGKASILDPDRLPSPRRIDLEQQPDRHHAAIHRTGAERGRKGSRMRQEGSPLSINTLYRDRPRSGLTPVDARVNIVGQGASRVVYYSPCSTPRRFFLGRFIGTRPLVHIAGRETFNT